MTPSDLFRKGLPIALAAAVSGCGMVENDPHRFEELADRVANIRLSAEPSRDAPGQPSSDQAGLRPALRVQVLDPHALWDARDGGLRGFVESAAPAVAEAAAPAVIRAVADEAARAAASVRPGAQASAQTILQLGAFSSVERAREAWIRISGAGPLNDLNPIYEAVQVNGRDLVRLKVSAPADAAGDICRAVEANDPWCQAAGRS